MEPDTPILIDRDCNLPAHDLITIAFNTQHHWADRAWAVILLASKRERQTTDALRKTSQSDPVQWVRRDAQRSLEAVRELEKQATELCTA